MLGASDMMRLGTDAGPAAAQVLIMHSKKTVITYRFISFISAQKKLPSSASSACHDKKSPVFSKTGD